jgi:hypothetical protein
MTKVSSKRLCDMVAGEVRRTGREPARRRARSRIRDD